MTNQAKHHLYARHETSTRPQGNSQAMNETNHQVLDQAKKTAHVYNDSFPPVKVAQSNENNNKFARACHATSIFSFQCCALRAGGFPILSHPEFVYL